jgi:hypothetical protein
MLQWGEVELVGCTTTQVAMSELGQSRRFDDVRATSALPCHELTSIPDSSYIQATSARVINLGLLGLREPELLSSLM